MELGVIIAIIIGSVVSLIVLFSLILFYKYRKYKKTMAERNKLYGNIYVKLFAEHDSKNSKRRHTQSEGESQGVCNGIFDSKSINGQCGITDSEKAAMGVRESTEHKKFERSISFPIKRHDSLVSLTSKGQQEKGNSMLARTRWKSAGNLVAKLRSPKQQLMSHKLSLPKEYGSIGEAFKDDENDDEFDTDVYFFTDPNENRITSVPEVILTLNYDKEVSALTLTVVTITGLVQKANKGCSVKAILRPKSQQVYLTNTVEGDNPKFNEVMVFEGLEVKHLALSHLMLTVYRMPGARVTGEIFINLALLKLEEKKDCHFKYPLVNKPRIRRKSTYDKLLQAELGELLVLLHYQPAANRLRVVINKAKQLPKVEITPFRPDYQVVIQLCSNECPDPLEKKVTSSQTGENATWNEAFHFDLQDENLNNYNLELIVLEKRRYKPSDAVIGHVVLGIDNTTTEAESQWKDCASPCRLELPRWHTILPVIKYQSSC